MFDFLLISQYLWYSCIICLKGFLQKAVNVLAPIVMKAFSVYCYLNIQGVQHQKCQKERAKSLEEKIDPTLVKPKCVWKLYISCAKSYFLKNLKKRNLSVKVLFLCYTWMSLEPGISGIAILSHTHCSSARFPSAFESAKLA